MSRKAKLELSWDWKVDRGARSMLRRFEYNTRPYIDGVVASPSGFCLVYAQEGFATFRVIRNGRELCWRREYGKHLLPSEVGLARIAGRLLRAKS